MVDELVALRRIRWTELGLPPVDLVLSRGDRDHGEVIVVGEAGAAARREDSDHLEGIPIDRHLIADHGVQIAGARGTEDHDLCVLLDFLGRHEDAR